MVNNKLLGVLTSRIPGEKKLKKWTGYMNLIWAVVMEIQIASRATQLKRR